MLTFRVPVPYVWDLRKVIAVPADVLLHDGPKSSAETMMAEMWHMISSKFLWLSIADNFG